jgi:hypothetical protein
MLWLAVPRAAASLIMFDAETTLTSLRLGEAVPTAARVKLLAQQRSALEWSDAGGTWIDYGFAIMASDARSTGRKKGSAKAVSMAAERALRRGLSRMPVSPEGWYLLAVLRRGMSGRSAEAASAIRMSVFTGPHVPVLAILRLRLMLRLWPQFSKSERAMVYHQIRYAWSVAPDDFIALAVKAQNDWPIRIALALQPKELQRFEEKLRAAKKAAPAK